MSKKIILFTILVLISYCNAFCQLIGINQNEMFSYHGKTLIVVLDDDEMSDSLFQKVFKAEWDLTPYKFVSESEMEKNIKEYKNDKNNLYLVFHSEFKSYSFAQLGDEIHIRKIEIEYEKRKIVKLGRYVLLKFDQHEFQEADLIKLLSNYKGFLNVNKEGNLAIPSPEIKNRTLLIDNVYTYVSDVSRSDIEKVYKSPFEIVSSNDIAQAIVTKRKDVFLLDIGSLSYSRTVTYIDNSRPTRTHAVGCLLFTIYSMNNSVEYYLKVGGYQLSKKKFLKQLRDIQKKLDKQKN